MQTRRPQRLKGVSYVGFQRYFLTICTAFKRQLFSSASTVECVRSQLLHTASSCDFETTAYCFMPDHVHALLSGTSEQADFPAFAKRFKQVTGFEFRKEQRAPLWQPGYHERILRDDEATEAVVRYILENPIRAGLSRELGEYPFAGSDVYDVRDLTMLWSQRT